MDTTATESGTASGAGMAGTGTGTGTTVVHAVKVVLLWTVALACTVASGLCKEVGFMAFPAFLCIDLFVSPALARATGSLPPAVEGAAAGGTAVGSTRAAGGAGGAGGGRRFLLGGLVQASTLARTAATLVFGAWVLRVRMSLHEGQPLRVWDVMENHIMHEPVWFKRVLNYAYVHAR